MSKRVAIARTVPTAIRLGWSKVYVHRAGGKDLPRAHTVNEAGKRGLDGPPAR